MIGILTFVQTVSAAANLEISNTADFSHLSTDFSGGETIFVRIESFVLGSVNSRLNLRDNQYNLINSFQLGREGNFFSAIIPTSYEEGYYSLEAKIEARDVNKTGIKTIKVGNPDEGDIQVNEDASMEVKRIEESEEIENIKGTEISEYRSFGKYMVDVFREVFRFIWPFS